VPAPIPVWVITGPLGCGKTTLIARWLASKPAEENWVVLLNEYTDAGIDALTVAAAARGAYDVRLVPGGCLCCAGEADFRRNLRELVKQVRPAGILVEPSGIGHPGGIVEELLAHEAAGALELCSVIGLIDPEHLDSVDETVVAVREIADVLLLSKADTATAEQRAQFARNAADLFPPKVWVGEIERGEWPAAARAAWSRALPGRRARVLPARPALHAQEQEQEQEQEHAQGHAHVENNTSCVAIGSIEGERREFHQLGRHGARWVLPRALAFSETRLLSILSSDLSLIDPALSRPERFKAVLRVGEEDWLLVQMLNGRMTMQSTAWRRDNRLELQLPPGAAWDAAAWERLWLRCRV
jgi:G3E family GTPase